MKVDFGHGECECIISLETAMVYEQEFKSDIVKDVMGKLTKDDNENVIMDYTNVNWIACVKALWAGLKVANPSMPPYELWIQDTESINANKVVDAVVPEVIRQFFRAGATVSA